MKKLKGKVISLVALCAVVLPLLVLVCSAIFSTNPYYKNHSEYRQMFGIMAYETLRCKSTDEDKNEMMLILDNVGEAFAYLGAEKDSPIHSPYNELCYFKDTNPDQVSVDYQIDFVTVQKFMEKGHLWFEYKNMYYDENGNKLHGSGSDSEKILCMAKIKKENGQWVAYDIKQEP